MAGVIPPSPEIPVVQPDGRISEQWRAFFYELWARTGGQQEKELVVGSGLVGRGELDSPLELDFTSPANVDHTGVAIIAGLGLSGGGTIEQSRTLNITFQQLAEDHDPAKHRYYLAAQHRNGALRVIRLDRLFDPVTNELEEKINEHIAKLDNPHETSVENLIDTELDGLAEDDFLQWDGDDWVNRTPEQVAGDLDHDELQNTGTNTHAQIDSHIAAENNPHSVEAEQVPYDNTGSGMTATDVQAAIDELEARVEALEP